MNDCDKCNQPYALLKEEEQRRRLEMLNHPHISPLESYFQNLDRDIPHFDPCDGGINARLLLLLQDPGPKVRTTGFISRNNPDLTALNVLNLISNAGIPRRETLLWNFVPWHLDGKAIRKSHETEAEILFRALLRLCPNLRVILLFGFEAQKARLWVPTQPRMHTLASGHPGERNMRSRTWEWMEIFERLIEARDLLNLPENRND